MARNCVHNESRALNEALLGPSTEYSVLYYCGSSANHVFFGFLLTRRSPGHKFGLHDDLQSISFTGLSML
jgi:hypothetical protein